MEAVNLDLIRARMHAESLRERRVGSIGESMGNMTIASHLEVMADEIERLNRLVDDLSAVLGTKGAEHKAEVDRLTQSLAEADGYATELEIRLHDCNETRKGG